jgi:ligand-binding SRPBCC domain-containing protein
MQNEQKQGRHCCVLVKQTTMSSYVLKSTQKLPIDLPTAWEFFSSPRNLKEITPSYLNFKILTNSDSEKMFAGQIITYHVSPLLGIPLFWMTEITHVREGEYFIDEQRFGPYALWHHKHFFKEIPGGIEMTDYVDYKLPLGFIGNIAHALFIRKQIEGIFDYRTKVLIDRFGAFNG